MSAFNKKTESTRIKEEILIALRESPLTFKEVWDLYPKYPRSQISNWLCSLRNMKLIKHTKLDDKQNKDKYYSVSNKTFTEVMNERMELNNQIRKRSYQKRQIEQQALPYAKVYKMEEFEHKSKGNKIKVNAWQGYTTFNSL